MRKSKLCVHGATMITMEPGSKGASRGWLTVGHDGKIEAVGVGDAPRDIDADQTIDATGRFVAPGFVSAHSHLSTSGSRGLGMDSALYGWSDYMSRITRFCDAEDIYWAVLHGSIDVLSNGVTTAYDFTDSRLAFGMNSNGEREQYGDFKPAAYAEAQIRAKIDAGLRFIDSILIYDQVGTDQEIEERFEETMRFARASDHGGLYLGTAISGSVQWSDDPLTARREASLMKRLGVINQPHFLETIQKLDVQRSKFAWYEQAGALGPSLIFGHFVHATPEMICTAAGCGCAMSWQPTANGRLASGIANIPYMVEQGMRVGVGLDDQSCTDIADPWQNMRMGIYMQRAHNSDPTAMGVEQMLRLHTMGSAEALGIADKVGSLEVGKYADFLIVDPRQPDLGPVWDPIGTYVLACGLRNLKSVYVSGNLISEEGVSRNPLARRASSELHARLGLIAGQQETDYFLLVDPA